MKISQLIEELQAAKEKHGDLSVRARIYRGPVDGEISEAVDSVAVGGFVGEPGIFAEIEAGFDKYEGF